MRTTLRRKLLVLAAFVLSAPAGARADSVAAKNREGNRLFAEGKYREAEKAYGEAQGKAPLRPELLYNSGNALLKQKNYDAAVQSLRQSIARGDRSLQARAWYNIGDAQFEAGRYRESADAFIQSLRIDPSDHDTKYNLELALRKLKEQQNQKQSQGGSQNDDQNKDQSQDQQNPKDAQNRPPPKSDSQPQDSSTGQSKPANPQATQADRNEATYSRERALQILDALQNQELAEQRKLLEQRARRKAAGKDW
jgi:Ca-activated chloride channel homolog